VVGATGENSEKSARCRIDYVKSQSRSLLRVFASVRRRACARVVAAVFATSVPSRFSKVSSTVIWYHTFVASQLF